MIPEWAQIIILVILLEGVSVGRGPITMTYRLYKHLGRTENVLEEEE